MARLVAYALGGAFTLAGGVAHGYFMRVGPLFFDAETSLQSVYTSNVEGQRPSQAEKSREDYYFVYSLSLSGDAALARNTDLTLDTSFSVEKHIIRDDLDNESAPFGSVDLRTETRFRHSVLNVFLSYKRNDESFGGFMPGDRKELQPHDDFSYGMGWAWSFRRFSANASYSYDHTRYVDEEFKAGDKDTTSLGFSLGWQISRRFQLSFSHDRKLDYFIYAWEDDDEWQVTSRFNLNYRVIEDPSLTASAGFERSTENADTTRWYPTYGLNFGPELPLIDTPIWELTVAASWGYTRDDDSEDMDLSFSGLLRHQITRTADHSLRVTEQPVDTFGSNKDTDQTSVTYTFRKEDLFMYNLNLTAGVGWTENRPVKDKRLQDDEQPEAERTVTYNVSLEHNRALSRRLDRDISVRYRLEDSNQQEELLDEYRAELTFTYNF